MDIKITNLKWSGKLYQRKSTKFIILHCTATAEGKPFSVEQVHRMHLANQWAGIGYNYLIGLDGSIHEGRPDNCVGAHAGAEINPVSVGICYVGGVDAAMKPKDTRTKEQKESLFQLVRYCLLKYNLTINDVRAHNEFAAKACPSFKIEAFRKEYLNWLDTSCR